MMTNSEFTAKGGTRFKQRPDGDVELYAYPNDPGRVFPVTDLIEFVRSVEGRGRSHSTTLNETLFDQWQAYFATLPPPLSRRTEVLAMMAATLMATTKFGDVEACVSNAQLLLAAVETEGDQR